MNITINNPINCDVYPIIYFFRKKIVLLKFINNFEVYVPNVIGYNKIKRQTNIYVD